MPYDRQPPKRFFRGPEFGRLMTMIMMLFVLFMMIQQARNPQTWKWLVSRQNQQKEVVGKTEPEKNPPAADKAGKTVAPPPAKTPLQADANPPPTQAPAVKDDVAAVNPKSQSSNPKSEISTSKSTAATGPTDEDEDESNAAREEFDFVVDGTLELQRKEDTKAYERVVRWVIDQPYDRLASRAQYKDPAYSQLAAAPADFRGAGKLFRIDMVVRRALKYDVKMPVYNEDDPHEPVTLYEMVGFTDEARGRVMYLVVYDPPDGMPLGPDIQEPVHFAGYFFKMQGYQPAKANPNSRPLLAPLFIGRLAWQPQAPVTPAAEVEWLWPILVLGGAALLGLGIWLRIMLSGKKRHNVAEVATDLPVPGVVTIDDWLDNVEGTQPADGESNGHEASYTSPSDHGSDQNGHANGHARLFGDPADGSQPLDG